MAEIAPIKNLALAGDFDHSCEIAQVMGVDEDSLDLSYAAALCFSRAQTGNGFDPIAMSDLNTQAAETLAAQGWATAYFRADSITYEERAVEQFAVAHGIEPEEATEKLRAVGGFLTDLRIGKPLVTLETVDSLEQFLPQVQDTVKKRLSSEYGYKKNRELSWSPFPTLIAHVYNKEKPVVDLVLCAIGTETESFDGDPAALEGNEKISVNNISSEERAAMSGLYEALTNEGRELLLGPVAA